MHETKNEQKHYNCGNVLKFARGFGRDHAQLIDSEDV